MHRNRLGRTIPLTNLALVVQEGDTGHDIWLGGSQIGGTALKFGQSARKRRDYLLHSVLRSWLPKSLSRTPVVLALEERHSFGSLGSAHAFVLWSP